MMPDEPQIPEPLSKAELRKLLLEALEKAPGSQSPETFHARFDHPERGLTLDDVVHALEGEWTLGRKPRFNRQHWQWVYEIAAEAVDGPVTIIVAVDTRNRSFEVITRWRNTTA